MRALIALNIGARVERLSATLSGCGASALRAFWRAIMLIFVYGTLRRGESNHRELGPARYVASACTLPRYELVDMGHYPALLEAGSDAVRGELYDVPDSWVMHLDLFEDVPSLYERKTIELADAQAIGYVMRRETAGTAQRIVSGDWCER